MRALVIVGTLAVAASGCYQPSFNSCAVSCSAESQCPEGTSCGADGFCHSPDTENADCRGASAIDSGVPAPDADPNAPDADPNAPDADPNAPDADPNAPDAAVIAPDARQPVGPCAPPMLVATVESLNERGGRVVRISLGANDTFTRCDDLTGEGTLPDQPTALAWVPPQTVAVASRTQTALLDVATDAVVWSTPRDTIVLPREAILLDANGVTRLLVALHNPVTTNEIGALELYDLTDGSFVDSIQVLSGVTSLARNPRDPSLYLQLRPDTYAAAEANRFTGVLRSSPPYVRLPADTALARLQTLFDRPARVAWVGQDTAEVQGLYYFNDPDLGANNNSVLGPLVCDAMDREYLAAVPDPTLDTRFFALTELGGQRQIVRLRSTGGACDAVLSAGALPPSTRISHIAVVEAP